jgi:hypothetical protein
MYDVFGNLTATAEQPCQSHHGSPAIGIEVLEGSKRPSFDRNRPSLRNRRVFVLIRCQRTVGTANFSLIAQGTFGTSSPEMRGAYCSSTSRP